MDLRDEIERMAAECGGAVAVAATHLPVERCLEREAQRSFPSASVIKVPILAALHAEAEAGRLSWEERMPLTEAAKALRAIRPDRHFRAHRGCPRPRRCRGRHRPHRPGDLRCVGRGGQQLMRTDPMVPYPWPHSPQ